MRFIRIVLKNFQTLESADVEFCAGLNVLHGPNDLGKSTLASAIRAALLVPPSSTEASRYAPWFFDAVPEVTLTLQDEDNRYWRVRKSFGATASQASADLHHSKDGSNFGLVCRGREVEDELRKLLAWGIPSPGGKGAPRKLPTSFLSQVLLAEQTAVETIFGQGLDDDGATSGKDRLRKALAALAEDPRFKTILAEVQKKVVEYFSASGQRKRGRESPFLQVAEEIKRRTARVDDLRKGVAESESTEELIGQLRESCSLAQVAHIDASEALEDVRRLLLRCEERAGAEQELAAAAAAVSALDRQAQDVAERERALTELSAQIATGEKHAAEARQSVEMADVAVRQAEEALRAASGEEGTRQRELLRAQLGAERAELIARATQTQNRLETLRAAQAAALSATEAAATEGVARAAAERAQADGAKLKGELADAERELEIARALLAYGHWQAAREAGRQAEEARTKAEASRATVISKAKAAEERESRASEKAAEANALREMLPDPVLTARLEQLCHELAIGEAALGGGFSIAVRGNGKIPVRISLDGRDAIAETVIDGRVVLEADRTAVLHAGDLLDIEIVAGAADQRRAVEALRERWAHEAAPILTRAGVATLPEIRKRLADATNLANAAEALWLEAKQLRTEFEAARQAAESQEQRTNELLARAGESDALESKLAGLDATLLARRFGELGPTWKQQAEEAVTGKDSSVSLIRDKLAAATREHDATSFRASEAADRTAAAQAAAARTRISLELASTDSNSDPLAAATAGVEAELATFSSRRATIDAQLQAISAQDTNALTKAQQALDSAHAARERLLSEQNQKVQMLDEARSRSDTARGHIAALRAALAAGDRAGAEARVTAARAVLNRYADDALLPVDALHAAERRELEARNAFTRISREVAQAEGALSKVGGAPLREELRREQDAVELAKKQQHELEVDAEAWKLLNETLLEAEKAGTSHLGNSLAGPVSARLVELTGARYNGLRLDQHLRVEGVDVAAVANRDDVLEALSVGTRDQIATLLRLTIAEQLGTAIILDDHLVHADPERLAWFRRLLREAARKTQVIVITCRAEDYLERAETTHGVQGDTARAIDFRQVAKRPVGMAPLTTKAGASEKQSRT
jgi:hypothetical protein